MAHYYCSKKKHTLKHVHLVFNAPVANWILLPSIYNQISDQIILPETKGRMNVNDFQGLENKNIESCHDSREDHVRKLRVASKVSQHCSLKICSIV